jgi:hypothetical protein
MFNWSPSGKRSRSVPRLKEGYGMDETNSKKHEAESNTALAKYTIGLQ